MQTFLASPRYACFADVCCRDATWRLARATLELLAEHEELDLVVDGEHTSTGDTTEDVGTGTLEERLDTLLGDDLLASVEGRLVLDGLCEVVSWGFVK